MASPVKVGIISIGEMGLGIARLLAAHQIPVATCLANRSAATVQRAKSASIEIFDNHKSFVDHADIILSIVPPRDAIETARAVVSAANDQKPSGSHGRTLHYLDLNAISPDSAAKIAGIATSHGDEPSREIIYVDGGIIGGPPKPSHDEAKPWTKPSIVLSGPQALDSPTAPLWGKQLMSILNMKHISPAVGQASGLKMCFASLTKGFTSIAIQSYTTAHCLGVLPELREHLEIYSPASKTVAERSLVGMPPKAYRWVNEMEEISHTFEVEGGFEGKMFDAVAKIYKSVAEETILGEEKTGHRKRGLDPEDVAVAMSDGLAKKRRRRQSR